MPLHLSSALAQPSELISLTYRSRAVTPLSSDELASLGRASSARNHGEGVTGLMVHDEGRFFQWLEGPALGLSRIWDSVSRDPRHTGIERVHVNPIPTRLFADWGMRVLQRNTAPRIWQRQSAALPIAEIGARLDALHRIAPDPAAHELTQLLLASDPAAAAELASVAHARIGLFARSCTALFEPVARRLGDLWYEDDCTGVEVTLAICRLNTIVRGLRLVPTLAGAGLHAVLVAPQPGELHSLGSALDSELLWEAGCDAQLEFPATNEALATLLSGTWFDALDLSLSSALRREECLGPMATTITLARRASLNPALVVLVGGRWFSEHLDEGKRVGADVTCATAAMVVPSLQQASLRPLGVR